MGSTINFVHTDISLKIILGLGIGLLVGLERESASKDVGVRTFALISLLGLMSQIIGMSFLPIAFIGILFLTAYMNVRAMLVNRSLEITTSSAMLVTFCLGVLVGQGQVFAPVASAILMTMLLAWKTELAAFAHGLKLGEIRSAVMLALLTFVIYPILPNAYVDPWSLFNPSDAWTTVMILAAISFVNYVLLKIYSDRGLYYAAFLGGAVNSRAAVMEISQFVKISSGRTVARALPILLSITVAMFVRNLIILGALEPGAIGIALLPLLGMTLAAVFLMYWAGKRREDSEMPTLDLASPVSLRRILKFGFLFVVLNALCILAERYLGDAAVMGISFLGGFVSSASATAAVAKLASQGKITDTVAGVATVLTSIASACLNLPLVYQLTHDKTLTRRLAIHTAGCILSGLALMAIVAWIQHWS